MRALTIAERDMLSVASNAVKHPELFWARDEPDKMALLESLASRGCVVRSVTPGEWHGRQGTWTQYHITDLGRLALRVSLPSPP